MLFRQCLHIIEGTRLDSTEVYRPSAGEWTVVYDAALPWGKWKLSVATLNNRVLLFGEEIKYFKLCFSGEIAI